MTALKAELVRLIADDGPMPVSRYMALCLGHPRHGYYMTRDPFGAMGDFTTAPEISQMFGEMIGLWAAHLWQAMGAPSRFALVEIGPGRGTLMADMLRATRIVPGLHAAASVHLVETSPALREIQAATLAGKAEPAWHDRVETALDGPLIVIANELLDALPLDQFVMTREGWCERLVGLDGEGKLAFGLGAALSDPPNEDAHDPGRHARPRAEHPRLEPGPRLAKTWMAGTSPTMTDAPQGSVYEHAQAALDMVSTIARHLADKGGGALFIDYGSLQSGFGDTLQAMRRHVFVDPLAEPGEADLTVHVDFARMAQAALRSGAAVHGPVRQGDFLLALGLAERAQALSRKARPDQAGAIGAAFDRLTERGETGMGELFKVLALSHAGLPPLPGFDLHRLPEQG